MSDVSAQPGMKRGKIGWLAALSGRHLRHRSVAVLVVANLVPLYGVIHWGWDLFVLMTAYWLETGIIGFWTAVRMIMAARWGALLLVPFFLVHFGLFMSAHILFLWAMFGGAWQTAPVAGPGELAFVLIFGTGLWLAFVALFLSHGASFYFNVLRGEGAASLPGAKPPGANEIMMTPYGRIVVMHITILIGAMLVQFFQTTLAAFVLLIGLKTVADVAAHVRKNFAP